MSRRLLAGAMLALIALVVPACGGGQKEYRFEVHPVDGRVVQQGKPVPGAFVRFHPANPATVEIPKGQEGPPVMLTTETDADGRFAMSTYVADDGIPAGDYSVTVAVGLAEVDVENSDARRGARSGQVATPSGTYRDPATTPLKATVKPGENHFAFELD